MKLSYYESFDLLKNQFISLSFLKRGGQKKVLFASHQEYGECVVKLFFDTNNPRSAREIHIEQELSLDSVPKIFETGFVKYEETDTLYVIEQRVEGEELRDILLTGKRFSLKEAVDILEQGLQFIIQMEENNIVHRDIKPENIIIDKDGRLFFIDFGIARVIGEKSITNTDALFGPHSPGSSG